jgi:uncharacterized protein (DUF849 family)
VSIKACLSGTRKAGEHPALPLLPEQLARDGRRAVDAGAGTLHLHPRRSGGSRRSEREVWEWRLKRCTSLFRTS